jgi:AcrR family transcriptional regulator
MADLSDPRAVRSRAALLAVAAELLDDPDAGDPSVTQVAARAGVSRPTFYQHFEDVPSLVAEALRVQLDAVFARTDAAYGHLPGLDFMRCTTAALVANMHEHRRGFRRVLHGAGLYAVLAAAVDYVTVRMREHVLGEHLASGETQIDDDRLTTLASGTIWLLLRWIDTDPDDLGTDTPEETAARLTRLLLALTGFEDAPAAHAVVSLPAAPAVLPTLAAPTAPGRPAAPAALHPPAAPAVLHALAAPAAPRASAPHGPAAPAASGTSTA